MPSAYAKTKTQFLYKHANGQYYARGYAQGKSVWRSLKTDLYSAAVARLKPALDEIRLQPNPATASAATLGDLIGLYLAQVSRRVGIKPSTVHYRKQLFARIRKEWPGVDDLVPRKVSVKQAEEFAAALAKGLSPTRYNNSIDSLRAVFRIGMDCVCARSRW